MKSAKGSSPRVWGQALFCISIKASVRIIPTRVGTSKIVLEENVATEDHPHACGDKYNNNDIFILRRGSSPRVWGQETVIQFSQRGCRIIPTRVGTSNHLLGDFFRCGDHPHACGDKVFMPCVRSVPIGSSPRVWGQDCDLAPDEVQGRIIPTRVGTR